MNCDTNGRLVVIHIDDLLVAVDKPAGLLVHRSALDAHERDDLVTRLRQQLGGPVWPVHRLDKGTSGLLLLARQPEAATLLGTSFRAATVHKQYLALLRGWPANEGRLDHALARDPEIPSAGQVHREASTCWRVLKRLEWPVRSRQGHDTTRAALVLVQPLTGRRHQIRRHFKHLSHPLIGDATHGKGPLNRTVAEFLGMPRLWLHALTLELSHPATGQKLLLRCEPSPEWLPLGWDKSLVSQA